MKSISLILFLALAALAPAPASAGLLLSGDIGPFQQRTVEKGRERSAVSVDRTDQSAETVYVDGATDRYVAVRVTKHARGKADKRLLHELDMDFRNYFGIPDPGYGVREIGGRTVLMHIREGRTYRWLSRTTMVQVACRHSDRHKPEPLDVVEAYLAKYPPTMPADAFKQAKDLENVLSWIREEMDRRLQIAGDLAGRSAPRGAALADRIYAISDNLVVFVNYREQYFGILSKNDRIAMANEQKRNDLPAYRVRIGEYRAWWEKNRNSSIIRRTFNSVEKWGGEI